MEGIPEDECFKALSGEGRAGSDSIWLNYFDGDRKTCLPELTSKGCGLKWC